MGWISYVVYMDTKYMEYFYGIVEDRQDPLMVGRVRVRIHGIHTDDKLLIATADLPWCQVILPTTSAGLSGLGTGHGLVEGSTVFGYFRDKAKQDPIVLGVAAGIPQAGYKEDITDALITRSIEKGFNDPRRKTQAEYSGTADGLNPPSAPNRPNELTSSLDTAPHLLKNPNIKYDGTGSVREEFTEADKTLPYYPISKDATELNVFTTGEADYSSRDLSEQIKDKKTTISVLEPGTVGADEFGRKDKEVTGAKSNATPLYPYNKAHYTESGHIVELDDTRGNERISVEHRTGTFYEIDHEGNELKFQSKDWEDLITENGELREYVYQLICDKVILQYQEKRGIDDVEFTDEVIGD